MELSVSPDVQRSKGYVSHSFHNLKVPFTATLADENAWPEAVFAGGISHDWTSSTGNLPSGQPVESLAACGGGKPSNSMKCTLSGSTLTKWKSDSNVAAKLLGNADIMRAGVAKTTPVMPIEDVRRMNCCGGCQVHLGRSECHCHHQDQHHHHQQQQQQKPSVMSAGNPSNNEILNGHFQSARLSFFKKAFSGNRPQHHGGNPRHHQAHHYQQHHGSHHNPIHVAGPARRSHRHRGFGAAAVEVIRNRTLAGNSSPHHKTRSPANRGRKRHWKPCHVNEQEGHTEFLVPLPRSRLSLDGRQESSTPVDEEVKTKFTASGSELGSGVVGDNTPSAFRLSNIAPFYECAIQQLITICGRRTSNAPEAAHGTSCNENPENLQKPILSSCLASIRSFDMASSVNLKSFSAPPSKFSLSQHALFTRTLCSSVGGSMQHGSGMEETFCSLNDMDPTQNEGQQNEEKEIQSVAMASGDAPKLVSEEVKEQEASPTMVQQLIESIGVHVAYGDAAPMVLIGALVYISRITLQSPSEDVGVTNANWYRLVAIAILIATKMYVDGSRKWNERISKATGISLKEVQKLELDFLFLIDFALLIKEEEVETWAEWMESVARKRGMSTQLRAFIFGRNSCPPSTATTPLSSFAGEDAFSRSFSHIPSGNLPSTPVSLTPANMTPQINAHVSPGTMKSACLSQRLSMSFVLDLAEKHPRPTSHLHPSPSSFHACETPNQFFPSPMYASLDFHRTERLFSIVHAPEEPSTPVKLLEVSQLFNDAPNSIPFTPPEQETRSPIEFFKRSFLAEGACNSDTSSGKARCGMDVFQKSTGKNDARRLDFDTFDAFDEEQTPPHRPLNVLSPPDQLNIALPPRAEYNCFANFKKNNSNRDIPFNNGKTFTVTAPQLLCSFPQKREDKNVRENATRSSASGSAEKRTSRTKADTNEVTPHVKIKSKYDKLVHAISNVRELFSAKPLCVRDTPFNVLSVATDGSGTANIGERDMYNNNNNNNNSKDVDDRYVAECDEDEDHDEFLDEFEDDRDNFFLRCRPVLTHSPPA
ncbi:putative G1 cyclin CycE4 [Trypanosoma cruzi]|nr:putative G1 cyclin CycE4 [Trypanosoma cruzi]